MKYLLAVSIILAVGSSLSAQQAEAKNQGSKTNYRELVKGLASPNKPLDCWDEGRENHKPDIPPSYDMAAQAPIEKNRRTLFEHCEEALPALIEGCTDTRYSLTWQSDSYCDNSCVGEVCLEIVASHLEVYREYMSLGSKKGVYAYRFVPQINAAIGEKVTEEKKKEIEEWWQKRKDKSLLELQIEAFDWAIEKRKNDAETRGEGDAAKDIKRLTAVRDKLKKNHKCLPPRHIPLSIGGSQEKKTDK